jgi:hypothetical protein
MYIYTFYVRLLLITSATRARALSLSLSLQEFHPLDAQQHLHRLHSASRHDGHQIFRQVIFFFVCEFHFLGTSSPIEYVILKINKKKFKKTLKGT